MEANSGIEMSLTRDTDEEEELTRLCYLFSLTNSTDYQNVQVGSKLGYVTTARHYVLFTKTYSHDIFGIVEHATGKSRVYIFDERLGPKNSDHTISYLHHYLSDIPSWIRRIPIFLDDAGGTNKNMYTMAWAMEMVQHKKKINIVRISFIIAGHAKVSVDQLFSQIAQSFNKSDVSTAELGKVAEPYASVIIDQGDIVME